MRQDQRAQRVQPAEVPHQEEEGDRQRLDGHHLRDQEHDQQGGPETEAESGDRRRREKRDQRQTTTTDPATKAVPSQNGRILLLPEDAPEGIQGGRKRPRPAADLISPPVLKPRSEHHPVEGEGDDHRDQQRGRLAASRQGRRGRRTKPGIRLTCPRSSRRYTSVTASRITSMTTPIAEPRPYCEEAKAFW